MTEKTYYDLTNPQKSIFLTEQYYSNTNVNNICGTAIIKDKLDFMLLEKAINILIENNNSFRLKFVKSNNTLKQYVNDYFFQPIKLIDLSSENEVSALEQSLVNKLFNLEEKTSEIVMFRFPEGNGGFIVNIHHIVSDAWTLGLLCRKIMEAYSILDNNEDISQIKKSSYIDYINSEKDYLKSDKFTSDEQFWNTTFSSLPNSISIPASTAYSNTFSCVAKRENFVMPKKQVNLIKKLCKSHKLSLFNLFMSIISIYLYKINNINDFVIGTPILNRLNFNEKNTTGMFINIAPFKVNIPENSTCIDFFKQISRDSMGLLRHQKYPLKQVFQYLF